MEAEDRLPLDSERWVELRGGHGRYDAAPILEELLEGYLPLDRFWSLAWAELHHQGEVGNASYLAIPWIWAHYCSNELEPDEELVWFVGTVERCRHRGDNELLLEAYAKGFQRSLREIAATCAAVVRSSHGFHFLKGSMHLLAVLAGQDELAELMDLVEEDQVAELIAQLE